MDQPAWAQVLIAWGSGPFILGVLGFVQWHRDRKDKLRKNAVEEQSEDRKESVSRSQVLDAGFTRLSSEQQTYIASIKQDRTDLQTRCDEYEDENRKLSDAVWAVVLWGRDMRTAALNARMIADGLSKRLGDAPFAWQELPEWQKKD